MNIAESFQQMFERYTGLNTIKQRYFLLNFLGDIVFHTRILLLLLGEERDIH